MNYPTLHEVYPLPKDYRLEPGQYASLPRRGNVIPDWLVACPRCGERFEVPHDALDSSWRPPEPNLAFIRSPLECPLCLLRFVAFRGKVIPVKEGS